MNASGNVVQVTNFYPSGASLAESPARSDQGTQPYKYYGKELDREGGWDAYNYGARMYDPAMGRFMTMDPLAEKYYSVSPYVYCNNNPVKYVDPDGKMPWIPLVIAAGKGAVSSFLPGKVVDNVTSAANKALTSDLTANSAATMTNETKNMLKSAQTTINSEGVQTGTNVVADYVGGVVGGQVNEELNKR